MAGLLDELPDAPPEPKAEKGLLDQLPDAPPPHPLETTYRDALDADPERTAKVIKASGALGVDKHFAEANLDAVAKVANAPMPSFWRELEREHPGTAEFLGDPEMMAVAKDEISALQEQEKTARDLTTWQQVYYPIASGLNRIAASAARVPGLAYDVGVLPTNLFLKAIDAGPEAQLRAPGWLAAEDSAGFWERQAQGFTTPAMREDVLALLQRGEIGKAGQALAAQFAANFPTQAAIIAGTMTGVGVPALVGAGVLAAGDAAGQARKSKADPAMATVDAVAHGAFEAAFERVGTFGLLKKWEGEIAKALGKKVSREVMYAFGRTIAQSIMGEAAEETLTQGSQDLADYLTGVNPRALEDIGHRMINAGIAGGFSGGLLTGSGAIIYGHVKARVREVQAAEKAKEFYLALGEQAKASKLRERLPDAERRFLNMATAGGPLAAVDIPAEAVERYFQAKQIDPAKVMADLGVGAEYLDAKQRGDFVRVPISAMTSLIEDGHYDGLADDVRIGDIPSVNEAKERQKEAEAEVQAAVEEAKAAVAQDETARAGYDLVFQDVSVKMRSITRPAAMDEKKWAQVIEATATEVASQALAESKRRGMSVEEYYTGQRRPAITDRAPESGVAPGAMQQPGALLGRRSYTVLAEAIPAPELADPILQADQQRKEEFTGRALPLVEEIGQALGIPASVTRGAGLFEGMVSPNVVISIDPTGDPKADEARVGSFARALQFVFRQKAVPWMRAQPDGAFAGVLFTFERLDAQTEQKFAEALQGALTKQAGYTKLNEKEIVVVNYGGLDEAAFFAALDQVDEQVPGESTRFRSGGDYGPEHDWGTDPQGSGLVRSLGAAGSPDLQERLLAAQARFDGLRSDFQRLGQQAVSERGRAGQEGLAGSLRPLEGLPRSSPGPTQEVLVSAQRYSASTGIPFRRQAAYVKADPARGAKIADEYDALKHDPENPEVKAAYDALIRETLAQFQAIKRLGIIVEPIKPGMENPYPNGSRDLIADLRAGHLWYFPTEQGFGSLTETTKHPLLAETSEVVGGQKLLANDVFRIVHDVYGHAKEGVGFGPDGEENAWQSHVRMYSPLAARAMTTETRGQNSWVNFGPFGEQNRREPLKTIFAEQKAGLLPEWAGTEGLAPDAEGRLNQSAIASPFFSKLEQEIEKKITGSAATVEQVRAMLREIKEDERKWSGIDEFLAKQKDGRVEKAALLEFLKANRVEITDVTVGGEAAESEIEQAFTEIAEDFFFEHYESSFYITQVENDEGDEVWAVAHSYDSGFAKDSENQFEKESDAQDRADKLNEEDQDYQLREFMREMDSRTRDKFMREARDRVGVQETKYEEYTLPGGDNYRELLFVLRDKARERVQKLSGERTELSRELDAIKRTKGKTKKKEAAKLKKIERRLREIDMTVGDLQASGKDEDFGFRSSHFDDDNILAHTRLKDRRDLHGNRVLFIEEIQSDWHQKGRDKGYKHKLTEDETQHVLNLQKELEVAGDERRRLDNEITMLFTSLLYKDSGKPRSHEAVRADPEYVAKKNELRAAEDKVYAIRETLEQFEATDGVPDAPLKKTWHEFVLKRLIRFAAENGYDKIAWTTGEQQAERYSLDKQVDRLEYDPASNNLVAYRGGSSVIDTTVKPEGLPEMIGREAAEKLLAQEPAKEEAALTELPFGARPVKLADGTWWVADENGEDLTQRPGENETSFPTREEAKAQALANINEFRRKEGAPRRFRQFFRGPKPGVKVLAGLNLKMGGEGMKFFYDRILVQFADKFGKKWGAKVEDFAIRLDRGSDLVHGLLIPPDMKRAALFEGFPLFQAAPGEEPRGFYDPALNLIALLRGADESTAIHELNHKWAREIFQYIRSGQATEKYLAAWRPVEEWLGITAEQQAMTTEQYEKLASAWEVWHFEGKAPSSKLKRAFLLFKRWLTGIYRKAIATAAGISEAQVSRLSDEQRSAALQKHFGIELTDGVRNFFARMLATEEELADAAQETGYAPLIELEGLDPAVAARIKDLQEKAHDTAEEALLKQVMGELKGKDEAWRAKERERQTAETEKWLSQEPLYEAQDHLRRLFGLADADLDKKKQAKPSAFTERPVQKAAEKFLSGKLEPGRIAAFEAAAEMFGFGDGRDLAIKLAAAKPLDQAVSDIVEARLRRIGEPDRSQMREQARAAIYADESLTMELLALEREALAEMVRSAEIRAEVTRRKREDAKVVAAAIRDQARQTLAGQPIGKATSWRPYITAERNAAIKVAKALAAKDYEKAAKHKREQMVNHALAAEALRNEREVEKIGKFLRRFERRGSDLLGMPYGFVRQIDDLLSRSGLAAVNPEDRPTLAKIAEQMVEDGANPLEIANATGLRQVNGGWQPESLAELSERVNENYYAMTLPASVLMPPSRPGPGAMFQLGGQNRMTMGELRDIRDAVKVLNAVGRNFERWLSDFIKGDIKEAARQLRESIEREVGQPYTEGLKVGSLHESALKEKLDALLQLPDAVIPDMVNLLTLCRFLDGGNENGPATRYIYRTLKTAEDRKLVRYEQMTREVNDLLAKHFTPEELSGYKTERWYFAAVGRWLTREQILAVGLNWGNEGNRDRIRKGDGQRGGQWEDAQIKTILDALTKKDWDAIQDIWDYLDTFWPEIVALEMKAKGEAPERVEPTPVTTRYGDYRGGYYPIAYDFEKSEEAHRNAQEKNALFKQFSTAAAHTDQGHAKARVAEVKRPIRLSLDVLFNHLENVVHDLEFRTAVIDVARFLRQDEVKAAIEGAVGPRGMRAINEGLKAIASDQGEFLNLAEKAFRWFRFGVTQSTLAYRLFTFPLDVSGNVINGIWEIGPKRLAAAMKAFVLDPTATVEFVNSKSERMRRRATMRDRDIADIQRKWSGKESAIQQYAFIVQAFADAAVSYPLWAEVYRQALDQHGEEAAKHIADEAITRTMGSGSILDQVGAQRGGEAKKIWSMYYTWLSMMFNRAWLGGRLAGLQYGQGNVAAAVAILAKTTLFAWGLQAINENFWRELFRNRKDEDEEARKKRVLSRVLQQPFAYVWVVRDIAGGVIDAAVGKREDYKFSPLEQALESVIKTVGKGAQIALTDKELDRKYLEEAARAGSYITGFPLAINNLAFNLIDWIEGEGEFTWRDAMTRRTRN